ncbi:uncharacterized protein LOC129589995 isoform X2 [Paramacrobiotus metropolitanus]|nr:uncharacterized protein LOC129589995 isoform X2 [Paramacrobiotus metropolitanus]
MAHFLKTKQLWYNGLAVELFLLIQIMGYLSNLAFTSATPTYPVAVSAVLVLLVDLYRRYTCTLRTLDPERTFYQFDQLRRPLVPDRGLQLIQLTPLVYAVLLKAEPYIDVSTYSKIRYSLGMTDAIVYVGLNLDVALVVLTRVVGTLRTAVCEFSVHNIAWMFRVNITGAYTLMLRDLGWKSIPSDQMHLAWMVYLVLKVTVVSAQWSTSAPVALREGYGSYVARALSSSFVAATATVYFACLAAGMLLTSVASVLTCSSDVVPKGNFLKGIFDTVQVIRWNSFPWKVKPELQVRLLAHAVMFGQIPLCGKMIKNIGQTVRRKCQCDENIWRRSVGGVMAIALYFIYACVVAKHITIAAPLVSECFGRQINKMTSVWIAYNFIVALVEVVTIFVYQGLVTPTARSQMDKGTALFRSSLTGVLAVSLTIVNGIGLHDTLVNDICGYRDMVNNILQIVARVAFIYITVNGESDEELMQKLRNVESLTYHNSATSIPAAAEEDPCGLCYGMDTEEERPLVKLAGCRHTFHAECFAAWENVGNRCPVCRSVFQRSEIVRVEERKEPGLTEENEEEYGEKACDDSDENSCD